MFTDFLSAVEQRQIEQCEILLQQVQELSRQNQHAAYWHTYFAAILTDIRDSDWADAERQYHTVLVNPQISQFLRGQVLLSLGISYWRQARWREAEDTHREALKIYTETREVLEQVKTQNNLAALYWSGFSQGDFDARVLPKAEVFCTTSLKALDNLAKTPDVLSLYAMVWNTLGMVSMSLGRWERAIDCYEHVLACHRQLGNGFGMGIAYANMGETYHRQGSSFYDEALTQYAKALAIFQEGGHLNEALDILANLGALYASREQFTQSLENYAAAIQLSEKLRSGLTSEIARAGYFSTINDIFANAVLTCHQLGLTGQAFNYTEQARSRAFLDLLETGLVELERDMGATPMTLTEVQAALPENALLLEYFTTGLIEARQVAASDPMRHRFPPPCTLVFAVTRREAHLIDADIAPNDLYPQDPEAMVSRDLLTPFMRRVLYEKLVAPFSHLLKQKTTLYLAPHGPLHYVPFQALLDAGNNTLLAADGPQIVYAPSATVLLRNPALQQHIANRSKSESPSVPCLAVGHNGGAVQLTFAEEEARGVVALMQGQALVGAAATKANVLQSAPQAQILHLSCHGTFDPASPLDSALHLANGEKLTAREVLEQLPLHCRLVTLSACESGLNRVQRGDELFGMVRAFMFAGAAALIVTQWRVDERSTHILMERFYQNLQQKMPIPQALQEAQLYLRSITRAQAENILLRLIQQSRTLNAQPSTFIAKGHAVLNERLADLSSAEANAATEERVFDDPYHWAPFVLIGGYNITQSDMD
ncbi:MAG: CHAT domain-containing tetratricopeptide repeat protein [Caldilineaceae bacterium]